jgi:putative component of membrane protein insertase Oxa1/YidC/SpoIIIJ protein YidD
MQILFFTKFARNFCMACITGYQKYLSPHKGFVCAHRILYQQESCSQYIKNMVKREGIFVAFKKSHPRFQACKQANNIIREKRLRCACNSTNSLNPQINLSTLSTSLSNFNSNNINPNNINSLATSAGNRENGESEENRDRQDKKRKRDKHLHDSCDCSGGETCFDAVSMPCELMDMDCGGLDCGGLADCGGLDCGGLADCGALNCS